MQFNLKRNNVAAWFLGTALIGIAGCGGGGTSSQGSGARAGEILFVSDRQPPSGTVFNKLFKANLDGSNVSFVMSQGTFIEEPVWFPGRQEFVYSTSVGGTRGTPLSIRRASRSGTNDREILPNYASSPAISPNGSRIAYVGITYVGRDNPDLFIANADGTQSVRVASGSDPSWSPDGQRIVYTSLTTTNGVANEGVFVMNADGSNSTRLTTSAEQNSDPAFSPDGSRIVYASKINGDNEIYVMNSDGSNQTRLTNRTGFDGNPKWTPDGRRIVYNAASVGVAIKIYIMNADGSNPVNLFNNASSESGFDIR